MSSRMPNRRPSVHLSPHLPNKQKAPATGHPRPPMRSGRAFAGQSGICVVAKPPVEVQRSFSMSQIEVTTRRGRERGRDPKPCEKTHKNKCPPPTRAPSLGARSLVARLHQVLTPAHRKRPARRPSAARASARISQDQAFRRSLGLTFHLGSSGEGTELNHEFGPALASMDT